MEDKNVKLCFDNLEIHVRKLKKKTGNTEASKASRYW